MYYFSNNNDQNRNRMLRNGKRLSQVFHYNDKFMQVQRQNRNESNRIESDRIKSNQMKSKRKRRSPE